MEIRLRCRSLGVMVAKACATLMVYLRLLSLTAHAARPEPPRSAAGPAPVVVCVARPPPCRASGSGAREVGPSAPAGAGGHDRARTRRGGKRLRPFSATWPTGPTGALEGPENPQAAGTSKLGSHTLAHPPRRDVMDQARPAPGLAPPSHRRAGRRAQGGPAIPHYPTPYSSHLCPLRFSSFLPRPVSSSNSLMAARSFDKWRYGARGTGPSAREDMRCRGRSPRPIPLPPASSTTTPGGRPSWPG